MTVGGLEEEEDHQEHQCDQTTPPDHEEDGPYHGPDHEEDGPDHEEDPNPNRKTAQTTRKALTLTGRRHEERPQTRMTEEEKEEEDDHDDRPDHR